MEKRAGAFIVIEGSDGSGKATQLNLIKQKLEAAGHRVAVFDFPRYDQPSSYFVKRYLEGAYGRANDIGPYTSSLFYALDRFEAAPHIRRALEDGNIVISNRFTGSNMAHQGTKIANAEQRRGFFIWLDNLEFEMLRIPRPDISFVLRVPPELSAQLMASRPSLDLHETDLVHQQRTVAVYDEMTQLFPKDFQRLDCVRSGQLLDIETINTMLWEKISPLLPAPAAPPTEIEIRPPAPAQEIKAAAVQEIKQQAAEQKPQATAGPQLITLENASSLIAQKVERLCTTARVEHPDIPGVYTPPNLIPDAQKTYDTKANALLGLYAKLVAGLAKRGIGAAEARHYAGQALPVAVTASIRLEVTDPRLKELIISLMSDSLPEAQLAGASLYAQAVSANPQRFQGADQPADKAAHTTVKALAEEFLTENLIGTQPKVQLTGVWPRNELDLVADMLYEQSNLPLRTIQDRLNTWPMGRRLAVFEAYIGDARPGSALEKAHYNWDLETPYSVFRELQKLPCEALSIQPLTPRYGYDIPELIEDADLSDTFEKCFDLSLELYSTLQQAGHQLEAQYATLHGHSQRWRLTLNAAQSASLHKLETATPDTKTLLRHMREKQTEAHPILSEIIG